MQHILEDGWKRRKCNWKMVARSTKSKGVLFLPCDSSGGVHSAIIEAANTLLAARVSTLLSLKRFQLHVSIKHSLDCERARL